MTTAKLIAPMGTKVGDSHEEQAAQDTIFSFVRLQTWSKQFKFYECIRMIDKLTNLPRQYNQCQCGQFESDAVKAEEDLRCQNFVLTKNSQWLKQTRIRCSPLPVPLQGTESDFKCAVLSPPSSQLR